MHHCPFATSERLARAKNSDRLWRWESVPKVGRLLLITGLLLGSLVFTIRDYRAYGNNPEVGYYFEAAAVGLAQQLNVEGSEIAQYLDERFWSSWPALSFLVTNEDQVNLFYYSGDLPEQIEPPTAIL